ncbi:MAG: hypothetical protein JW849_09505 [Phycisphaerae bacterium]|nr:hypothetical protein [Phycisphaerae bacterium]
MKIFVFDSSHGRKPFPLPTCKTRIDDERQMGRNPEFCFFA